MGLLLVLAGLVVTLPAGCSLNSLNKGGHVRKVGDPVPPAAEGGETKQVEGGALPEDASGKMAVDNSESDGFVKRNTYTDLTSSLISS